MIAKDYVFPAGGPEAKAKLLEDLDTVIDDVKFSPRVCFQLSHPKTYMNPSKLITFNSRKVGSKKTLSKWKW